MRRCLFRGDLDSHRHGTLANPLLRTCSDTDLEAILKFDGSDGTPDPGWHTPSDGSSVVNSLSLDGAGNLYAGGHFANIGGVARKSLAKLATGGANPGAVDPLWDPSATDSPSPSASPGYVFGLLADGNGGVFVSGDFSHVGGAVRGSCCTNYGLTGFAKLSASGEGTADPVWNPAPSGSVLSMALDGPDTLLIGGNFTSTGGETRHALAALPTDADDGGGDGTLIFGNGFE